MLVNISQDEVKGNIHQYNYSGDYQRKTRTVLKMSILKIEIEMSISKILHKFNLICSFHLKPSTWTTFLMQFTRVFLLQLAKFSFLAFENCHPGLSCIFSAFRNCIFFHPIYFFLRNINKSLSDHFEISAPYCFPYNHITRGDYSRISCNPRPIRSTESL